MPPCGLGQKYIMPWKIISLDPNGTVPLLVAKQKHCVQDIYERSYTGFIFDATANGLTLVKLLET